MQHVIWDHYYVLYCISRDCVKDVSPTSPLYESLLPSGGIMQSLLQYVWSLWEDPVDVSVYAFQLQSKCMCLALYMCHHTHNKK